jgi:hypothetical protein
MAVVAQRIHSRVTARKGLTVATSIDHKVDVAHLWLEVEIQENGATLRDLYVRRRVNDLGLSDWRE